MTDVCACLFFFMFGSNKHFFIDLVSKRNFVVFILLINLEGKNKN